MPDRYEASKFYSAEARRQIDTTNALVVQAEFACRREMLRAGLSHADIETFLTSFADTGNPYLNGCRDQLLSLVHCCGVTLQRLFLDEYKRSIEGRGAPLNPNAGKTTGEGAYRIDKFYSPVARRQVETAVALEVQSKLAYQNAVERAGMTFVNVFRDTGDQYLDGRRDQYQSLGHAIGVILWNLTWAERTRVAAERESA